MNYNDLQRMYEQLLGLGSPGRQADLTGISAGETNDTAGTWMGIQRNEVPMWSSRIQISAQQIQESQRGGAFTQAMQDEYASMLRQSQQVVLREQYDLMKDGAGLQYIHWDPDMEMDIGL